MVIRICAYENTAHIIHGSDEVEITIPPKRGLEKRVMEAVKRVMRQTEERRDVFRAKERLAAEDRKRAAGL